MPHTFAPRVERPSFRCHTWSERDLTAAIGSWAPQAVCWAREQLLLGGEMLCALGKNVKINVGNMVNSW